MPRRPHLRRRVSPTGRGPRVAAALLAGSTVWSLAGCGELQVEPPSLTSAERSACARLVAALPSSVSDQRRRSLDQQDRATAAWGDPAIELRCGVPRPKGFTPTASCQTTDGIDWYVPTSAIDDPGSDVVMTVVDRFPMVQVRLPATYRPPAAAMVDLTRALRRTTRVTGSCR